MIFETTSIYNVNPEDGCLDERSGRVRLVDNDLRSNEAAMVPFTLSGVRHLDLAIFGDMLDDYGVFSHGLLVIQSESGYGQVASSRAVEIFPKLQTIELARKCATLHDYELAQLGIECITAQLAKRYPNIKGFKR